MSHNHAAIFMCHYIAAVVDTALLNNDRLLVLYFRQAMVGIVVGSTGGGGLVIMKSPK
jgi:hypothetical protein